MLSCILARATGGAARRSPSANLDSTWSVDGNCRLSRWNLHLTSAYAQDHKAELTGDYSYFRANPGLPPYFNSQNLNGGGGQVAFYLSNWFGVAGDLQGYGSYKQCTKPGAPVTGCPSGNLFTYMFDPQVKYRAGKLEPLAEVLLGGAHSNFYASGCTKLGVCGCAG